MVLCELLLPLGSGGGRVPGRGACQGLARARVAGCGYRTSFSEAGAESQVLEKGRTVAPDHGKPDSTGIPAVGVTHSLDAREEQTIEE